MFTLEDLSRAVECTQRLCALPAIPSTGWCDLAAEALVPRDPRDVVVVALAHRTSEGLTILEPIHQVRLERELQLWQWLDGLPREFTATGRQVSHCEAGRSSFVVVASPIGGPRRSGMGPWVLIGVSLTAAPPDAVRHEAQYLCALMPRLAERCHIAFRDADPPEPLHLTPAEQRVLEMIVLGKTVNEIAESLGRSPHTIHDHVKSLHRKLGANSRGQLIARALGVFEPVRSSAQ